MSERNYYIYKVMLDNEEENVFFRPNSSDRMMRLLAYKLSGYTIIGYVRVNQEDWYNAKLQQYCNEYCDLDNDERKLHYEYRNGMYRHSTDCLLETLTLIQDRKWTILKIVHSLINQMVRRDLDIRVELAIILNDQFIKAILQC